MYRAPTEDMQFLIDDVLDVGSVLGPLPHYADLGLGTELTTALLDEAGKFAADVVSPLRRVGDMRHKIRVGKACPSCLAPPPAKCGTALIWPLRWSLF